MSRSYKKSPFVTDNKRKRSKKVKRSANKTFRKKIKQSNSMPRKPQHRKYTDSWDICDYRMRMSKEQAVEYYNRYVQFYETFFERFPTLNEWLEFWEKQYIRK